ncbi:ribonuclease III [Coniochaeta ligniaria NRRL 30616]|uniref:Ribonuclease III n=1 Tax=Coniochaeta ligniaria NRRL 30616 TaxID=1408157 RepID=A0A1J7J2D7_9PEZI|nr:ribonuclease III [Coniochaeta ligniaria NRRL 30616]
MSQQKPSQNNHPYHHIFNRMAKRTHGDVASAPEPREDAPRDQKRTKTSHQDVHQSVNAFIELIANVKALDVDVDLNNRPLEIDNLQPGARKNLKTLSRSLLHFLPAIRALAEEEEQLPQHPSAPDVSVKSQEGQRPSPSSDTLTKWTVDDIPSSLPPLPAVLDSDIEVASFTHPGMAQRQTDMNYERLEWIGDAYLYVISCGLIYATFPTLSPGKCSQIRETLVKNITLCDFSLRYGFDKRANFPAEFGLDGRPGGTKVSNKERTKVLGDIFEAYVAAVVVSDPTNGFARATAWLKALWAGTIAKQIREASSLEKKAGELPPKTQLANLILAKGIKLRYEDAPGPSKKVSKDTRAPLYTINVYLDGWGETGKLLGWGTAPGKTEAGNKAAQCAMDNKKMIQVYAERKRAHMAALEAQRKEE